ncbi:MAG: YceD family protein [Aquificaceae bacterium]|nr:YceD family protein [Aquificaceae bacterium]
MRSVNLKKVFEKSRKFSTTLTLKHSELDLPNDIMDSGESFSAQITIYKKGAFYEATISVIGKVLLECSRCLSVFEKELNLKETLSLRPYPKTYRENLKIDDLAVSFIEDEENFDLINLVREQIILSIPTRRICSSESCQLPISSDGFSLRSLYDKAN